jgi:hypothetical protein
VRCRSSPEFPFRFIWVLGWSTWYLCANDPTPCTCNTNYLHILVLFNIVLRLNGATRRRNSCVNAPALEATCERIDIAGPTTGPTGMTGGHHLSQRFLSLCICRRSFALNCSGDVDRMCKGDADRIMPASCPLVLCVSTHSRLKRLPPLLSPRLSPYKPARSARGLF